MVDWKNKPTKIFRDEVFLLATTPKKIWLPYSSSSSKSLRVYLESYHPQLVAGQFGLSQYIPWDLSPQINVELLDREVIDQIAVPRIAQRQCKVVLVDRDAYLYFNK